MTLKTGAFSWYDGSGDVAVENQSFDALNNRFLVTPALNARTFPNTPDGTAAGSPMLVGDPTVVERGTKSVIWSSEGYVTSGNQVPNGLAVAAISAANRILASGTSSATNIAAQTAIPSAQQPLDFSPYRQLLVMVNFVSFTGGSSPTIIFELDGLDDTATAVSFPLWTSAALTTAGKLYTAIGTGLPFAQAAAAPATAPSNFTAFAAPSGWTLAIVPLPFPPQGLFKWTVANTPTAASWTAWIYGIR